MSGTNDHGNGNGHRPKVLPVAPPAVPSSTPAPALEVLPANAAPPATASASSVPQPAPDTSGFKPPARALALLKAYIALQGAGGRLSNRALGEAMEPPVEEDALRKWRKANPLADAWVMDQLRQAAEREWGAILWRASELAQKGSIDHMRFFAEVTGRLKGVKLPEGGAISVGDHAQIQVNVHGLPK